jgi:hypothetical protein
MGGRGWFVAGQESPQGSANNDPFRRGNFGTRSSRAGRDTALNKVCQNTILIRSFSEWSMGFVGEHEIQARMPFSLTGILMNMLSEDAKTKPLSIGTSAFISIYNQMRKSPYN